MTMENSTGKKIIKEFNGLVEKADAKLAAGDKLDWDEVSQLVTLPKDTGLLSLLAAVPAEEAAAFENASEELQITVLQIRQAIANQRDEQVLRPATFQSMNFNEKSRTHRNFLLETLRAEFIVLDEDTEAFATGELTSVEDVESAVNASNAMFGTYLDLPAMKDNSQRTLGL